MQIQSLELTDFRSYHRLRADIAPGVTVLVGPNGQGKTNLVEAVHRIALGSSHRVAGDGPMIRADQDEATVRVSLLTDEARVRRMELSFGHDVRTRMRVDGQEIRRASEAFGVLRLVMFAPEDLAIVRGDPSDRRKFLDDVLSQRRPAYAATKADYDRVLRQRNQLLKQLRGLSATSRGTALATLQSWTGQLIQQAAPLVAARLAAVAAMETPVAHHYQQLTTQDQTTTVRYRSSALDEPGAPDDSGIDPAIQPAVEDSSHVDARWAVGEPGNPSGSVPDVATVAHQLTARFATIEDQEIDRGITLAGPHRDDLELMINGLPARHYSSHGEAWTLALSLKLGTYDLLAEVGDRPVLILDDVFAELDERRRASLARVCAHYDQVIVTAAVQQDVPLRGDRWEIEQSSHGSIVTSSQP